MLDIPDLPRELDGLKIGQISDIHLGWMFTSSNLQRAIDWLNKLQPDLLALTGDFIGHDLDIDMLRTQLAGITAPAGVYAVLGNHDYWTDVAAIEQLFKEQGIVLLRNEQRTIVVNGVPLSIVGVDCVWEAQHNVEQAFNERLPELATIVLAHEPDIADEIVRYKPLLQLSGHTHGGHFALPLLGPAFLPRHGFRYFRGLQRVGGMWLYVSRGVGGFPLRLGCPPEAAVFTLRRAHSDEQR
jgi:predicted MPP superfamily phosphohydrolase